MWRTQTAKTCCWFLDYTANKQAAAVLPLFSQCPFFLFFFFQFVSLPHDQLPTMKVSVVSTFKNPHSCRHCSGIHLDLDVRRPKLLCFWCDFDGVPKGTSHGQYICEQCTREFFIRDNTEHHFTLKLGYDVEGIRDAAEEGCELYSWVWRGISREDSLKKGKYRVELYGWKTRGGRDGLGLMVRVFDGVTGERVPVLVANGVGELNVYAFEGDAAGVYTSCRPYVRDVRSEESMGFARGCLRGCLEGHTWCRTDQIIEIDMPRRPVGVLGGERVEYGDIPSRVLDLGRLDEPRLRLVETWEEGEELLGRISRGGFVALSYCWGGDQRAKLLSENLDAYKRSIDPLSLDQTLQDAIWVARQVGFQYLWIDALCIIQDNLDGFGTNPDKAFEITRMASYYGRATLTILAASASAAAEGFLAPRAFSPFRTGPVCVLLRNHDTKDIIGTVYLVEEHPSTPAEPITTRGWTLQESLLSRRILVFAQRQLYWSCVNSFAGAGGDVTVLTDRMIPGRRSLVEGVYPVGSLIDTSTTAQWGVIVEEYTRRFLGQEGDKLWAVGALAEQIVKVGRARGEKKRYVAGLLIDEEDKKSWLSALMWRPVDPGRKRPRRYRAPTWSWAGVNGEVRVGRLQNEEPAVVEDWGVEFAAKGAEYGALKPGAWLRLRGTVMTAEEVGRYGVVVWVKSDNSAMVLFQSFEPCDSPVDRSKWTALSDQPLWELKILEDSPEDKEAIMTTLANSDFQSMLLLIALDVWHTQGVAGILVERGAGEGQFLSREDGLCQGSP